MSLLLSKTKCKSYPSRIITFQKFWVWKLPIKVTDGAITCLYFQMTLDKQISTLECSRITLSLQNSKLQWLSTEKILTVLMLCCTLKLGMLLLIVSSLSMINGRISSFISIYLQEKESWRLSMKSMLTLTDTPGEKCSGIMTHIMGWSILSELIWAMTTTVTFSSSISLNLRRAKFVRFRSWEFSIEQALDLRNSIL